MSTEKYTPEIEAILSKPTISVDQAAKVLGVGRRQAYAAVQRGEIPAIHIGKRILISTSVVLRMLETGSNQEGE